MKINNNILLYHIITILNELYHLIKKWKLIIIFNYIIKKMKINDIIYLLYKKIFDNRWW